MHLAVVPILLVIALALQLQTILGEQLASDDQAADVVDIGTVISLGDGIARVYGCEAPSLATFNWIIPRRLSCWCAICHPCGHSLSVVCYHTSTRTIGA